MKKRFTAFILVLTAICILFTASCQGSTKITDEMIVKFVAADYGDFRFYGIVKSGADYYVRVTVEAEESPSDESYRYILLANELNAFFQDPNVVGAWNPSQYLSAAELENAAKKKLITEGAYFTCVVEDGRANYLEEYDYYEANGIDITNGNPK